MLNFIDIQEPISKNISNQDLLNGVNIPDIKKLETFSEDDFERIVEQLAFSYIGGKYKSVKRLGGSNDKGRDVFGYKDDEKQQLDIYQCKHYKDKIAPTDIYEEIGKLIYYTYKNSYILPENYYISSLKGCGPKLTEYLEKSNTLKDEVIKNWEKHCKKKITKDEEIELDDNLKQYINSFDFSIIKELTPLQLIEELEDTKYYAEWFGMKRLKRPDVPKPGEEIQANELVYANKLFKAYGSVDNTKISKKNELKPKHSEHFELQRTNFYSAEGLKHFSRDALPAEENFSDIQEQVINPVKSKINITEYSNGLECLGEAINIASGIEIGNNALKGFVKSGDKIGILHQVANEDENLDWT